MSLLKGNGAARPQHNEPYRIGVAGLMTNVFLSNGDSFAASFYLRLTGSYGSARESLGERLNDPDTAFLACKVEQQVQLVNLAWISYIQVAGALPEVEYREQVGATRHQARLLLRNGDELLGEFLSLMPSSRARVSDILNSSGERFLLFLVPGATCYVNRDAVERVCV